MIASAVAEVIPGRVSNSSLVAVLMLMGPLRLRPSNTPCATALASRFAAAVAFAVCSLIASGLLDSDEHPDRPRDDKMTTTAKIFICTQMPISPFGFRLRSQANPIAGAWKDCG